MCVVARGPVWSCRHHAFRQHPIREFIIPHRRRDRRARAPMRDANARDEFRTHHPPHHARHRTLALAHPSRERIVVEWMRQRERTNDPTDDDARASSSRPRVPRRARAYVRDTYLSTRRRSIDRSIDRSIGRRRRRRRRRPTLPPHDATFRRFKWSTRICRTRDDDDGDDDGANTFAIFMPVSRERARALNISHRRRRSSSSSSDARITSIRNAPRRRFIHWFARVVRVGAPRVCANSARDGTGGAWVDSYGHARGRDWSSCPTRARDKETQTKRRRRRIGG